MQFLIILSVIAVLGVRGDPNESGQPISDKEQLRYDLKKQLRDLFDSDVNDICPHSLSPEQTIFGNQKIVELLTCSNVTVDTLVDSLDFNVFHSDFSSPKTVRKYIAPLCQVFDDIFKCIKGVEPVIDMCISDDEKKFKSRLFTIIPLVQQTLCLKNGGLMADLLENDDGPRCLAHVYEWLNDVAFDEVFHDDNAVEFFASESLCREFNRLRLEVYKKLGECSVTVLDPVTEMLGFFCEETKCRRYIRDLECF